VCVTTYQPDTKSNPNPNPTTKQHAVVNIQLNIVTCPMYPDKFIQDLLLIRLCTALGCNYHNPSCVHNISMKTVCLALYNFCVCITNRRCLHHNTLDIFTIATTTVFCFCLQAFKCFISSVHQ